jgi:outer membrane protein TolC
MTRAAVLLTCAAASVAWAGEHSKAGRLPAPPAATQGESTSAWLLGAVGRPQGLKASDVAARAVDTSPLLKQRAEELFAAEAQVDQAGVGLVPRVVGSGRFAKLSDIADQTLGTVVVAPMAGPGPLMPGTVLANAPVTVPIPDHQLVFQAALVVPLSDYVLRLPQSLFAAQASRDAAALLRSLGRLGVALEARLTYYAWARAHLESVVAEQSLAQAKAHRVTAARLFDAGGASNADVLGVDAQVANAELLQSRVLMQEAVLWAQLRVMMHDGGGAKAEIGEALDEPLPATQVEAADALFEKARARRFEVKVREKTLAALGAQVNVARGGYLPRLDAFASAMYANPNPRYFPARDQFDGTWEVGVTVSYSPNDVATAAFASDAAQARRHAIELELEAFLDALRIETTQAAEAVKQADVAVETTKRALTAAEESYRVRKELFVNERSTSTELTDAETHLTQARINAVGARIDQRIARLRFEHTVGDDAERSQ